MIRTLSKKRAAQYRLYYPLAKKFREENPECAAGLEGCAGMTSEVHHKIGRMGDNLLKVETFLAVCSNCHHKIESSPAMAREKGFSGSRLNKDL